MREGWGMGCLAGGAPPCARGRGRPYDRQRPAQEGGPGVAAARAASWHHRPALPLALVLLLSLYGLGYAATCHIYQVAISGIVSNSFGQQQVAVSQYAFWRDQGFRNNAIEFGLFVNHDLNVNAQVGEIVLMTNSAFSPNPGVSSQSLDLAAVAVGEGSAQFQLDAGASFILPPTNVMVTPGWTSAPGGLGGLEFLPGAGGALGRQLRGATILQTTFVYPRNGVGAFALPTNTSITGQFEISASGIDNAGFEGFYQATFNGVYLGAQQC